LSADEETAGAIVNGLMYFDAQIPKDFAGLIEHLRAYVEGMVQPAVLLNGSDNRVLTLAKQDVMAAEGKARRA